MQRETHRRRGGEEIYEIPLDDEVREEEEERQTETEREREREQESGCLESLRWFFNNFNRYVGVMIGWLSSFRWNNFIRFGTTNHLLPLLRPPSSPSSPSPLSFHPLGGGERGREREREREGGRGGGGRGGRVIEGGDIPGLLVPSVTISCHLKRFLLVCVTSRETSRTISETLSIPEVAQYVAENFVLCMSEIEQNGGQRVAAMLGVSEYPYIYVIVPSLSRLVVVDGWGGHGGGLSAGMFMARLMQASDDYRSYLEREGREREREREGEERRELIQQQNDELEIARAMDASLREEQRLEEERKRREEQERESEEARKKKEEESRKKQAKMKEKAEEHRKQLEQERKTVTKTRRLPTEPPEGENGVVRVGFRLGDGTRISRRFFENDKIQSLYDFLDTRPATSLPDKYSLFTSFPRREYGDLSLALKEAGISSSILLEIKSL